MANETSNETPDGTPNEPSKPWESFAKLWNFDRQVITDAADKTAEGIAETIAIVTEAESSGTSREETVGKIGEKLASIMSGLDEKYASDKPKKEVEIPDGEEIILYKVHEAIQRQVEAGKVTAEGWQKCLQIAGEFGEYDDKLVNEMITKTVAEKYPGSEEYKPKGQLNGGNAALAGAALVGGGLAFLGTRGDKNKTQKDEKTGEEIPQKRSTFKTVLFTGVGAIVSGLALTAMIRGRGENDLMKKAAKGVDWFPGLSKLGR
jgi:hypothetical protein